MEIKNNKIAITLTRLGLAFVFLYAAISALINPVAWVGFFPAWIRGLMSLHLLIILFSSYQILLASWLISGKKTLYSSAFSAITIIFIIISNMNLLDIVFRDVDILVSALALIVLSRKES